MKRKILSLGYYHAAESPDICCRSRRHGHWRSALRHALQNNIQIKQQEIMTRYQESSLEQSKLNLLPTLNGSAHTTISLSAGHYDETTYRYTEGETVQSNSF
ncbi:MAG: hypothetical protein MZV63_67160 [Marinilabiliales bacterium]|nr:hypothetical protein [Marinilabiliales bacterium]